MRMIPAVSVAIVVASAFPCPSRGVGRCPQVAISNSQVERRLPERNGEKEFMIEIGDEAPKPHEKDWKPSIATMMSEQRSLKGVVWFLNSGEAQRHVDRYAVFEAMLTDADVKGPWLSFWSDDEAEVFEGIPVFAVSLGADFPLASLPEKERKKKGHVLVVRYLARLRVRADGQFYLEEPTLLGYVNMTQTHAEVLSRAARTRSVRK